MRLIDADALEIELLKLLLDGDDKLKSVADVAPFISNAPTVNAVEVVRCRECMFSKKIDNREPEITDWNVHATRYNYYAHSPWTSWILSQKVADSLKYIEVRW